ncbi:AAA family ATPase [Microbispora sp. NPDC049125]|uniref:ATP-binding protein n=1 Tax=Microbispora sp. NPDC049125 TaxID=3154929 RepID=UPI0034659AF7
MTFRDLVRAARMEQRLDVALDRYMEALASWQGAAAGDGTAPESRVVSVFTALDNEFIGACLTATRLAVRQGRVAELLHPLHLAARMAPLHEHVQASLMSALAAAGQRAEALALFRTVRARLADALGIDPGPALLAAHREVLEAVHEREVRFRPGPIPLVGRDRELAVLREMLAAGTGLVVVEGEPGVGKTRLLMGACAEAEQRGALVLWGHCLQGDGTPSMWPWLQVISAALGSLPAAAQAEWRAGELGRLVEPDPGVAGAVGPADTGTQFRLFEQAVALIGRVAARRPVVLVVDDLQWADVASLELFRHLTEWLPGGTVVIGALRDRAPVPGSELARTLASASRLAAHRRIRLRPFGLDDVAELIRRESGRDPDPDVVTAIHARTAGNVFFVRELSRSVAGNGVLGDGVPSSVRDVVWDRIADLTGDALGLLQVAALIGRDIDLVLLAKTATLEMPECLKGLEPLEELGLLEPLPGHPGAVRFAHDLVRESVADLTPQRRLTRLHLQVADALERTSPDDSTAERLAHHLRAAGPLADPARTVDALVRAGRCAANKSALDAASRQLRSAAQIARAAGLAERELTALAMLTAVDGMRAGYAGSAPEVLERAENLARDLGHERQATDFLFSRWVAHGQGLQLDKSSRLARRLLIQGEASTDPIVRAYGLHAWGIHQWAVGNIGQAYRYLIRSTSTMRNDLVRRDDEPLRHDLQNLSPLMLALMTGLRGDVVHARAMFDRLETAAGDDRYTVTVWSAFAVTLAAQAGDPEWALSAAERGIALDPQFSFGFFGSYQRLARCWARAMTGHDPAGAAEEARLIIATTLSDPPRSVLGTWCGLLSEMWLAADRLDEAARTLDQAGVVLDTYGERDGEGLLLLLRARLLQAYGAPLADVRAAAERARTLAVEREANLFAHRAEQLIADLDQES